ncbi:hypothetical protein N2152v2_007987 [Parachlorella kessleri]
MASTMTCTALRASVARRAAPARRGAVKVQAAAKQIPHWLPGTPRKDYLDAADLPGNFSFDPLNLATNPTALTWFQQAELQNGRWAMLGVAGMLTPELGAKLGGFTGPAGRVPWYDVSNYDFWAPAPTLEAISFFLFAFVECRRLQDIAKPGSVDKAPFFGHELKGAGLGYPGFDPLGYMNTTPEKQNEWKLKEIKNGRLAMLAFAGFVAQHITTGTTPLTNLADHLADPWATTVLSNEHARLL